MKKIFFLATVLFFGCSEFPVAPETHLSEWRGPDLVILAQPGLEGVTYSRGGVRPILAGSATPAEKIQDPQGFLIRIEKEGSLDGYTRSLYLSIQGMDESYEYRLAEERGGTLKEGIIEIPVGAFFGP